MDNFYYVDPNLTITQERVILTKLSLKSVSEFIRGLGVRPHESISNPTHLDPYNIGDMVLQGKKKIKNKRRL